MTAFTKTVEFHAFKYVPGAIPEVVLEETIAKELDVFTHKIVEAAETEDGLVLEYLVNNEENVIIVKPGHWVLRDPKDPFFFTTQTEEELSAYATEVIE